MDCSELLKEPWVGRGHGVLFFGHHECQHGLEHLSHLPKTLGEITQRGENPNLAIPQFRRPTYPPSLHKPTGDRLVPDHGKVTLPRRAPDTPRSPSAFSLWPPHCRPHLSPAPPCPQSWDPELAAFAKAYAEKCVWGHNKERGRRGENLFAITDRGLDVPLAVGEWQLEYKHYNFSSNACNESQMCGHYTQVRCGCVCVYVYVCVRPRDVFSTYTWLCVWGVCVCVGGGWATLFLRWGIFYLEMLLEGPEW